MKNSFGTICREWRKQRRYSQLELALELGISSKHISFMETGRSLPSRDMILNIGTFLQLPKREINRSLYSAGFAPIYTELSENHEEMKYVFSAIDHMLENHMPYPAIVLNQHWDLIKANESAQHLMSQLGFAEHSNLVEAIIADDPDTSTIINWDQTALSVVTRLRQEISMLGGSKRLEALAETLAACLPPEASVANLVSDQPALSIKLQLRDQALSLFSIIAQLSTVQDVTASEYKVELMFPIDTKTENYYMRY